MREFKPTPEPVALVHAKWLDNSLIIGGPEAASELRRLHEVEKQRDALAQENKRLVAELEAAANYHASHECYSEAARLRKLIATVKEQP